MPDESPEPADGGVPSSSDAPGPAAVDSAIPLGDDETVQWVGHPRRTVVLPTVAVGIVFLFGAIAFAVVVDDMVATGIAVLVALGAIAFPLGHYVYVVNTQFVVTDHALYHKRGVLGHTVTQAALETVQNSAFTQSITGSMFDYGSIEFEIAGGRDMTFRDIRDPHPVRHLVDQKTADGDGIARSISDTDRIPGRIDDWRAVREEVRAIRRLL